MTHRLYSMDILPRAEEPVNGTTAADKGTSANDDNEDNE
jgi:hypothetical protein